jgi:death-on-curing protein
MVGMSEDQLDIADFLLIAEAVLGLDAKELVRVTRIPEAESALAAPFASFGGIDFYEDPVVRAAICCSRIVRNHPLPDGNKRVAFECMIEMLHRGGIIWDVGDADIDAEAIERLAARGISEPAFVSWLEARLEDRQAGSEIAANFDSELWQRTIFNALRPIDPSARFHVSLSELDFRDVKTSRPEDFPANELVAFVDGWLESITPTQTPHETEWEGGGARLTIQARGRGPSWQGWKGIPSFSLLEPEIGELHFTSGETKRFLDLTLEDIDQLAAGDAALIGQGPSYQDTFSGIAHEMRHFKWSSVADMPVNLILVHASMIGLVEGPPDLGNYDATWSAMNRKAPNN